MLCVHFHIEVPCLCVFLHIDVTCCVCVFTVSGPRAVVAVSCWGHEMSTVGASWATVLRAHRGSEMRGLPSAPLCSSLSCWHFTVPVVYLFDWRLKPWTLLKMAFPGWWLVPGWVRRAHRVAHKLESSRESTSASSPPLGATHMVSRLECVVSVQWKILRGSRQIHVKGIDVVISAEGHFSSFPPVSL